MNLFLQEKKKYRYGQGGDRPHPVLVEPLERRQLLSAPVIDIRGSAEPTEKIVVSADQAGISWTLNGRDNFKQYPKGLSAINIYAGSFRGKGTQGYHRIELRSTHDPGAPIRIFGTSFSRNDIVIVNNAAPVEVWGGTHSYNQLLATPTGAFAPITLRGGAYSTNVITSHARKSRLVGGAGSENHLTIANGGGYLVGGSRSTNVFNLSGGKNVVIGGERSSNRFFVKDDASAGRISAGPGSSNIVFTESGKRPAGYRLIGSIRTLRA